MPDRPFGKALARIVRKRMRALARDATSALARGRDDELHALRIDVKRLRYNVEFLAPLARDETLVALDLLALLQERLGSLADADAFARTYDALRPDMPPGDPREPGLATLRANAERERERSLAAVRALWGADDATYPERLAASISATLDSVSAKASYDGGETASKESVVAKARSKRSAL